MFVFMRPIVFIWYQSHTKTMGDIVATTERARDGGGSSTIKCPMLNTTNYTVWAMRMKILLRVHKVWEAVETEAENNEKNDMAFVPINSRESYTAGRRAWGSKASVGCYQNSACRSRAGQRSKTSNLNDRVRSFEDEGNRKH